VCLRAPNHDALDDVLELSDIPGPIGWSEWVDDVRIDASDPASEALVVTVHEGVDPFREITASFA